ncbi:MAG: hypothetical protein ACRDMV_23840 [Streptosporangiales bacterium]
MGTGRVRRLFRRSKRPGQLREANPADIAHLEQFARSRRGVEGYVEPRTAVTDTTLVLVAVDGEWTRRRVPSPKYAHEFANDLGVPSYDAAVVGYPKRMREWTSRKSAEQRNPNRLDEA